MEYRIPEYKKDINNDFAGTWKKQIKNFVFYNCICFKWATVKEVPKNSFFVKKTKENLNIRSMSWNTNGK